MKVLLVHPPTHSSKQTLAPPLGLAYLASVLRRHDHQVKTLDMRRRQFRNLRIVKQDILDFSPNLIGISATTFGYKKTLDVIRTAKLTQPDAPMVIGGPHASVMRDKLLRDSGELSFVVYGEGEFTLLELCNALVSSSDFSNIKGLIWRKGNEIITNPPRPLNDDLDNLPFAAESFDLFGFGKYYDPLQANIITSRGCPYGCIYCTVPEICGKKFRSRNPENVVDEIEFLHSRYGTRFFHFLDDNFSFNLSRAKKICDEILNRKLEITWDTPNGIRADRVDQELLCKMKAAGCQSVWFGLESANQKIVDGLNKHIKVSTVRKAILWSKECGLKVGVFFIIGSPGESFDTIRESVEFASSMNVDTVFSMLTPYPHTKLWDWVSTNARWTQNPYEYLYSHGHVDKAGVPFETDDFTKKDRDKAWKFAKRTITRKRRQLEYRTRLENVFPRPLNGTIIGMASVFLSTLWDIPLLNRVLHSRATSVLKNLALSRNI